MIKYILSIVITIIVIDALAFMAWILSGQTPASSFHFGSLTGHIIKLLLF